MQHFSGIEEFVTVVNDGSFTAAAKTLGVSKSHISKQISALEDRLGARLLNRTTRSLSLTAEGAAFHERCKQLVEDMQEAERAITQLHTEPRGVLRLTAPVMFGSKYVAPAIAEFCSRHEGLDVDIHFSDRLVDIVDEGYDLAIRIGSLRDSSFAFRKLAATKRVCCASPAYLAKRKIEHPDDLDPEECFQYAYATATAWLFRKGSVERQIRVNGRVRANNGEALKEAAIWGLGVTLIPDFMAADALRDGRLVSVLEEWTAPQENAIWALYPHSRHLSAKVRQFVDFLQSELSPRPWAS